MKKIKMLLYFIFELVLSLLLIASSGLMLARNSVYEKEFVKNQIVAANYYELLYQSIHDQMEENIYQAGVDETIINDLYSKEKITEETNRLIDCIYSGETFTIDTTELEAKFDQNLKNYLKVNNMKVSDQASVDKFKDIIVKIYKEEISMSKGTAIIEKAITKTKNYIDSALTVCIIAAIVLAILMKIIYYKEPVLSIPLIVTGLVIIFCKLLLEQNIIIDELFVWDEKVTSLLQQFLQYGLDKLKEYGKLSIIVGLVIAFINSLITCIITSIKDKKKKHSLPEEKNEKTTKKTDIKKETKKTDSQKETKKVDKKKESKKKDNLKK